MNFSHHICHDYVREEVVAHAENHLEIIQWVNFNKFIKIVE